jgi:hypothetical protein
VCHGYKTQNQYKNQLSNYVERLLELFQNYTIFCTISKEIGERFVFNAK